MPQSNINGISFAGSVHLKKDLGKNLAFSVEPNRCSFDLKKCEKYPGATFEDLCRMFNDKHHLFSSFFSRVKPPVKCPLKAGNYTFEESKLDFSIFSALAIDGYTWLATFKVLSPEEGVKRKRIVLCLNTETKIVQTRKLS